MSIRLFVEGGGDHNQTLRTLCRRGFAEFFRKAGLDERMPQVIACGGRGEAYKDFCRAFRATPERAMLLVDSEAPVSATPWEHVMLRPGDGWLRPDGGTDDQLHFMVEAMEAWFHGDREALAAFYGQHFRPAALSRRTNIDEIPKAELFSGLQAATAHCQKGAYSKGEHSFRILALIDPVKVRAASPWVERLLNALAPVTEPPR